MSTRDPVEIQNKYARSMAHSGSFYAAVVWCVIHFICLAATVAVCLHYIYEPNSSYIKNISPLVVILGTITASVVTFIIAFIKRRLARCPLCKGTPLLNTGALPHANAFCIPPLNHGYTAVISVIVSQKFCCMYCGTKFDLLKPSSSRRRASADARER